MRFFSRLSQLPFVFLLLAIGLCLSGMSQKDEERSYQAPSGKAAHVWDYRLSHGTSKAPEEESTVVQISALNPAESAPLLERIPDFPRAATDSDFSLPPSSQPPPRPGKTLAEPFPAKSAPPPKAPQEGPALGPLEITHYGPEGEIGLGARIEISFSQPMVALDSLDAHDSIAPPVQLTPAVSGSWRWLDPQTLLFIDKGRLPMATVYEVEIPTRLHAIFGKGLEEPFRFRFSTAPNEIAHFLASSPSQLSSQPVLLIISAQEVEEEKLLPLLSFQFMGRKVPARRATTAELEADTRLWKQAKDRPGVLAITPSEQLPLATALELVVQPGLPSKEGPRLSTKEKRFSLSTYAPFKITSHPNSHQKNLEPGQPIAIGFNNSIDSSSLKQANLSVTPEIPEMEVLVNGTNLAIHGKTAANTLYQIQIGANLRDLHDQALGVSQTLTAKFGNPRPSLSWNLNEISLLNPFQKAKIELQTKGYRKLKIRLFQGTPADWFSSRTPNDKGFHGSYASLKEPAREPNKTLLLTPQQPTQLEVLEVDLQPYLQQASPFLIFVEGNDPLELQKFPTRLASWVQVSNIGAYALADASQLRIWTNQLKSGKPIGADIEIWDSVSAAQNRPLLQLRSDKNGYASMPLPETGNSKLLVIRSGKERLFLPENSYEQGSSSWIARAFSPYFASWQFVDRGLYRPGEQVQLKGIVRSLDPSKTLPSFPTSLKGKQLDWVAHDSQGAELAKGKTTLDDFGSFAWHFDLPSAPALGDASISASIQDPSVYLNAISFQIAEFRRPEFEIKLEIDPSPHFLGEPLEARLKATYFAGGPIAQAKVSWETDAEEGHFTPPNWDAFQFGNLSMEEWEPDPQLNAYENTKALESQSDSFGQDQLSITLPPSVNGQPLLFDINGTIQDQNGQSFSALQSLTLHPAACYVGLRSNYAFVNQGKEYPFEFILVDLDGKPVQGRSVSILVRHKGSRPVGGVDEVEKQPYFDEVQEFQFTSTAEIGKFSFKTPKTGTYLLRAEVRDTRGRKQVTLLDCWVSGSESRGYEQRDSARLTPNRGSYQPGEIAEILVEAPFVPTEGVWTLERHAVIASGTFSCPKGSALIKLPISEEMLGGVRFRVHMIGKGGDESLAPKWTDADCFLSVPASKQRLAVEVATKQAEMEPGSICDVKIQVRDSLSRPKADAQVCFWAVDEAVLTLGDYQLEDPLSLFYPEVSGAWLATDIREYLVGNDANNSIEYAMAMPELARPSAQAYLSKNFNGAQAMAKSMDGGGMAPGAAPTPVQLRHNFNPLAVFLPDLRTDKDGIARAQFKLPDNLTRYRLIAVATNAATDFGKGEANLTARKQLMLRPSLPRFLNFGDSCELPYLLQNLTDKAMAVTFAIRTQNAELTAGAGRSLTIPANDRVEVRIPVRTLKAGTARFHAAVFGPNQLEDAAESALPVWTPASSEAFASYGSLDEGSLAQDIHAPQAVFPQFGGLKIATSSTILQNLTDAVLYLQNYPFECSEQISSRVLSVAALSDMMASFDPTYDAPTVRAAMERDLAKLEKMQRPDGGFGFWDQDSTPWPFLGIQVAHAVARATLKDFGAPAPLVTRSRNYLRKIEQTLNNLPKGQKLSPKAKQAIIAYALYVRRLFGEPDPNAAEAQLALRPLAETPFEVLGWLLPSLAPQSPTRTAILRHLANRVSQTASTAQFRSYYDDSAYLILHSSRRDDAVLLEALIEVEQKNPLILKLMRGLLANRTQGRWENTQECAWVLLAMDRYASSYESKTPDFSSNAWLGSALAQSIQFKGRSTDTHETLVPMSWLQSEQNQRLLLAKEGQGRLYYRLGLEYAPLDLAPKARSNGFTVTRNYAAVDHPEDVRRDSDGIWHIKRGARVKVELLMVAPERRYHVALVDPLPGGFEALNPELPAQSGPIPNDGTAQPYFRHWRWYEHQNLRDSQMEAFTSQLWGGKYSHSYYARATTPGSFTAPPCKAEEMYAPETFGRSAADRVIIE